MSFPYAQAPEASVPTAPARPSLDRLLDKAERGQWHVDEAIDWDLPPAPPNWISRKYFVSVISHLRAGEEATVGICRRLRRHVPEPAAHRLLDLQIADERRHASVYETYLARLGDSVAVDESFVEALESGNAWNGCWLGPMVAYHIVVEGEALRLQKELCQAFACPLFGALATRIAQDEARHVAFGRIYLDPKLAALPRDQRIDIYRWVRATWWDCAGAAFGRWSLGRWLARGELEERWARQVDALVDVGLIAVDERDQFRRVE